MAIDPSGRSTQGVVRRVEPIKEETAARESIHFQTAAIEVVIPAHAGIQYAAASLFDHGRLGILNRPLSLMMTARAFSPRDAPE
jgi:hypothetical protein